MNLSPRTEAGYIESAGTEEFTLRAGRHRNYQEFREFVFGGAGSQILMWDGNRIALGSDSDMTINSHTYRNVYHWLFKTRDGKIFHSRFYLDTLLANKAIEWLYERGSRHFCQCCSNFHTPRDLYDQTPDRRCLVHHLEFDGNKGLDAYE